MLPPTAQCYQSLLGEGNGKRMLQSPANDAGELRIEAANSASEQAICAAEEVKARERISLEADPLDDLVTSTPGKHRKLKYEFPC